MYQNLYNLYFSVKDDCLCGGNTARKTKIDRLLTEYKRVVKEQAFVNEHNIIIVVKEFLKKNGY